MQVVVPGFMLEDLVWVKTAIAAANTKWKARRMQHSVLSIIYGKVVDKARQRYVMSTMADMDLHVGTGKDVHGVTGVQWHYGRRKGRRLSNAIGTALACRHHSHQLRRSTGRPCEENEVEIVHGARGGRSC